MSKIDKSLAWASGVNDLTGVTLGQCAWDAQLLIDGGDATFNFIKDRDSLIVIRENVSVEMLALIGEKILQLREQINLKFDVMLMFDEPRFARRLKDNVLERINALGLAKVELLMMCVDDVAGLKAGSMMQTLGELKDEGLVGELGLFAQDVRWAEWLAINTGVRAIGTEFDLHNQDARYRTIETINGYGMVCFGFSDSRNADDLAFRLGNNRDCVSVIRVLGAKGLPKTMDKEDVNRAWDEYRGRNVEPERLPRGLPPN